MPFIITPNTVKVEGAQAKVHAKTQHFTKFLKTTPKYWVLSLLLYLSFFKCSKHSSYNPPKDLRQFNRIKFHIAPPHLIPHLFQEFSIP